MKSKARLNSNALLDNWTPGRQAFFLFSFVMQLCCLLIAQLHTVHTRLWLTLYASAFVTPLSRMQQNTENIDLFRLSDACFAYQSVYVGADEYRKRVRPRYAGVLTPPSLHHNCHIETQHK